MNMILRNRHVVSEAPDAFSTFRREYQVLTRHEGSKGRTVLEWNPDDPAVVLIPEHARNYQGLLRKDFQAAHAANAPADIIAKVEQAFGQDIDVIRSTRRTAGAGMMVYLALSDGIFQPMVQRTAPSKTPEGVPNPGVYSRPAGGITTTVEQTSFREMSEELNIGILAGSAVTSAMLTYEEFPPSLSGDFIMGALAQKREKDRSLLMHRAGQGITDFSRASFPITEFFVDGLHEELEQVVDNVSSISQKVVYFDDASNNGDIDSLIVADMRDYASQDLIIADGETGLQGEALNRTWILERPENLFKDMNEGTRKYSPLPRKVIAQTPAVMAAIGKLSL
ncbi:MAG: hypothetical protein WC989_04175 [Micavibrio sp.]